MYQERYTDKKVKCEETQVNCKNFLKIVSFSNVKLFGTVCAMVSIMHALENFLFINKTNLLKLGITTLDAYKYQKLSTNRMQKLV